MYAIKIKNQKFYLRSFVDGDADRPTWTSKKAEIKKFNSEEDVNTVFFALTKCSKVDWNIKIVKV